MKRDKKGRFIKGMVSWNKNKPLSKKHKKNLSKANKGKHNSPSTEFKKGNHPKAGFKKGHTSWSKNLKGEEFLKHYKHGHPKGMLGKNHSVDFKKKMFNRMIGKNNPHYGKKHTEKVKKKISKKKSLFRKFQINQKLKDYIDGLLLGDGTVYSTSRYSAYYTQGCKYKEWLDSIKTQFEKYGINSKVVRYGEFYYLRTLYYSTFLKFRKRWYIDRKKVVPKDIEFTPATVANWYLGDGNLYNGKITLATCSLNGKEVEFLSQSINKSIDINSVVRKWSKGKDIIYIGTKDAPKFLMFIKDFNISCYAYKFNWWLRKK